MFKLTALKKAEKKARFLVGALLLVAMGTFPQTVAEARSETGTHSALQGLTFGSLAYFDYSSGEKPLPDSSVSYNTFTLTRGYFTVVKQLRPWLRVRTTLDIHQRSDGNYQVRQKYLYAELHPGDVGIFTDMRAEIGLGHVPWLDFEEHINPYRCQGTMAVERAGIFNSADFGVSLRGYFGGKLPDAKQKTGNSHYTGRYGSWHIGVYNGGGYHAVEKNYEKVGVFRLSWRPLPRVVPGLQLSLFGLFGEGNTSVQPDYTANIGMLSYEHPALTLTAQVLETRGNAKGSFVDYTGASLKTRGWSVFGNLKRGIHRRVALFARYDYFDVDVDNRVAEKTAYTMALGGLVYRIYEGNFLLLAYETTDYESDSGGKGMAPIVGNNLGKDWRVQVVYQIKF